MKGGPLQGRCFIIQGFVQGRASPCCFKHNGRNISCVVHGDDFVFSALDHDLDWVRCEMEKRFLVKVIGKLGGDAGDDRELRILNRILRWSPEGIMYEADPRHGEMLLQGAEEGLRAVATPTVRTTTPKVRVGEQLEEVKSEREVESSPVELSESEAQVFRSYAARANYLALDRPDL